MIKAGFVLETWNFVLERTAFVGKKAVCIQWKDLVWRRKKYLYVFLNEVVSGRETGFPYTKAKQKYSRH